MRLRYLLLLAAGLAACRTTAPPPGPDALPVVTLRSGLVIERSVRVRPGTYVLPADSGRAAVTIRGDSLVVDLTGVVLRGAPVGSPPDAYTGTGLRLTGGRGITVRGAHVHGYKLGLHATDTPGLRVTEGDFSYNYRPRLKSTLAREHLDDWLSYHHNERDEWLRYGAGLYLRRAPGAQVDRTRATGNQNALLLTEVEGGRFFNNDFSFNSGLGIGLYRASRNLVMHNRLDWNVRGYSHGVYARGQDSAALLVYEQSSDNVFAYNSATHSGDGFFLWAGQTTMDTGRGGANDNLLYGNDFSHAPTNGVEITFSRNQVVKNRIDECTHGIWGGYSWETLIYGNQMAGNQRAVAIEHGQDNRIEGNVIAGGEVGLWLWSRPTQPADWGYARNRDVLSRDAVIARNRFAGVPLPLRLLGTDTLRVEGNTFSGFETLLAVDGGTAHLAFVDNSVRGPWRGLDSAAAALLAPMRALNRWMPPVENLVQPLAPDTLAFVVPPGPDPLPGGMDALLPAAHPRGRRYILVDEWGPYDFRRPILWPRSPRDSLVQELEILGPPGRWRLEAVRGGTLSAAEGTVPGTLRLLRDPAAVDYEVRLVYTGAATTTAFGEPVPAGRDVAFGTSRFFAPAAWQVRWHAWDDATDPRTQPEAFARLLAQPPLHQAATAELAYQWFGRPAPTVPPDRFATVAEGTLTLPPGRYRLAVTSDDGVRVWMDGRLVHDDWTYHAPRTAFVPLAGGTTHRLRIEHFEIDGYATIVAEVERAP